MNPEGNAPAMIPHARPLQIGAGIRPIPGGQVVDLQVVEGAKITIYPLQADFAMQLGQQLIQCAQQAQSQSIQRAPADFLRVLDGNGHKPS
jgi:hypothetical protein